MNKTTVLHFCGDLLKEFPDMVLESAKIARGNNNEIIKSSIKIIDELSKLCELEIERNNSKILSENIEKLKIIDNNRIKEKSLSTDYKLLEDQRERLLQYKAKIASEHDSLKREMLNCTVAVFNERNEQMDAVSEIESRLRKILNQVLEEKAKYLNNNTISNRNRIKAEECFRLLQREYNKLFNI